MGYPIVRVNVSNPAPVPPPVHCWLLFLPSLGPQPPLSRLSARLSPLFLIGNVQDPTENRRGWAISVRKGECCAEWRI